jgi:hypothetical protein
MDELMRRHIEARLSQRIGVASRERQACVRCGCEVESDMGGESDGTPPEMKERPGKSLASGLFTKNMSAIQSEENRRSNAL